MDNDINELMKIKDEQADIARRRTELMRRLRAAGLTLQKIADIYGCSRQYVEQVVNRKDTK